MVNKDFNRGDSVIVVNDTSEACVGQEAEFIQYNDGRMGYGRQYRYIVRILKYEHTTAVLEIRPLTLLEIELDS